MSISNWGVINVRFNDTLLLPDNLTFIANLPCIQFKIRDGLTQEIDSKNKNVTSFDIIKYDQNANIMTI